MSIYTLIDGTSRLTKTRHRIEVPPAGYTIRS